MGRSADKASKKVKAGLAEATKGVPGTEATRISECNGNGEATRGDRDDTSKR